ncbi:hypothetical protein PDTK01_15340 [Phycicoccus sp. DTK01]|nr:hypothetical protein PDTK01_15340 [Phycicoccus sp. DTK01]
MHTTREGSTMNDITPQQARERLAHAEAATGRRDAERRVHAWATAGFGAVMGAYLSLSRATDDTPLEQPLLVAYVLAVAGLATWQTRASRAWPRHARRAGRIGLGTTFGLFLVAVIGLNIREAEQKMDGLAPSENPWLLALAGVVVAAPMLLAAVRIRRGDPR